MVEEVDGGNLIGKKVCQTVIITFLEVPENKPPVRRIVSLAGSIDRDIKFRTSKDKVIVQGKIGLETMYNETEDLSEQPIYIMNHSIDFDYILAIPGLEEGMNTQTCTEIEYINYSIVDYYTVELEIIFRITAVVER